jgi:hypothetical protein
VSTEAVLTHDGVGVVSRGNLVIVLYAADARLHRTRWTFDRVDETVARCPEGILCLMVILPGGGPPDAPTRAENSSRFRKIDAALRTMVTVALGDQFRLSIVRAVMRGLILVSRQQGRHLIAVTEQEGLDKLLAGKGVGPTTPTRAQIEADLAALHAALQTPKKAATPPVSVSRT